ncbi:cobalt transporter [Qipengyuania flava]|uniref:Cobalt transporter n=1 Tax=Qipengyuania flava TaxID=192812 RepID=A0A3T1CKL9_9SPHN|nr:cation transporter [Qipengyuania flava]MAH14485.1 cation transporter [Sphingomonadaceae bacterium]UOR09545.1 cation transporter [Qipengyuania flava]BBI21539.1 cobalt transporter [Qipengyuania flava]|tara:strand:- start:1412 stop:2032 length:621 start_codon:yes stop_codon:yes gene_type:complete
MAKSCCQTPEPDAAAHNDPRWRRVLWIALTVNAAMFVVEMVAGVAADSRSLQADALDFFGDAANYAISLGVAGMALAWRARAALVKAATMLAFGIWVIGYAIYGLIAGADPEPATMGMVGTLALATNVIVALMLFQFREGDANMRSVWICSRNDAIGNVAVLGAALGVFGTGDAWPDLLVASIMAGLALWGSAEVFGQARRELSHG